MKNIANMKFGHALDVDKKKIYWCWVIIADCQNGQKTACFNLVDTELITGLFGAFWTGKVDRT